VLVPSDISAGSQQVIVTTGAGASSSYTVNVNAVEPGLIAPASFIVGGNHYVAALFPDYGTFAIPTGAIINVASHPAKPGDTLIIYGIGFGDVVPRIPAGQLVQEQNTLVAPLDIYTKRESEDTGAIHCGANRQLAPSSPRATAKYYRNSFKFRVGHPKSIPLGRIKSPRRRSASALALRPSGGARAKRADVRARGDQRASGRASATAVHPQWCTVPECASAISCSADRLRRPIRFRAKRRAANASAASGTAAACQRAVRRLWHSDGVAGPRHVKYLNLEDRLQRRDPGLELCQFRVAQLG